MKTLKMHNDQLSYPIGTQIKKAKVMIKETADLFKAIPEYREIDNLNLWCSGSSGAVLATMFAMEFDDEEIGIKISHVKKLGEDSHARGMCFTEYNAINIIVDDFIASGSTIRRIWEAMKDQLSYEIQPDIIILSYGCCDGDNMPHPTYLITN